MVIDTENNSADLYAHLGNYNVLNISAPFTPEKYIKAIELCEKESMEVIIIDSISHEWDGSGGILDISNSMVGNSFTNWAKLTPRHNSFVNKILQSQTHVIATIRTKQDYVLNEKNGKQVPEKIGLKGITRDGIDYEFTIVFDLDIKNHAISSKDRTQLFFGKPQEVLTVDAGITISEWCNMGSSMNEINTSTMEEKIKQRISETKSLEELIGIYQEYPEYQSLLKTSFSQRKNNLQSLNHTTHGNINN